MLHGVAYAPHTLYSDLRSKFHTPVRGNKRYMLGLLWNTNDWLDTESSLKMYRRTWQWCQGEGDPSAQGSMHKPVLKRQSQEFIVDVHQYAFL